LQRNWFNGTGISGEVPLAALHVGDLPMSVRAFTQTGPAADPADRRQFGRRAVVRHAWIVAGGGQRLACSIRNVSDGGALLELAVAATVANRFTLTLAEGTASAACEACHRSDTTVGVRFLKTQEAARFNELLIGTLAAVPKPAVRQAAPAPADAVAPQPPRAPAVIHLPSLPPVTSA
jgi:PilZ domain